MGCQKGVEREVVTCSIGGLLLVGARRTVEVFAGSALPQ